MIKNRTSTVPPERTAERIEKILVSAGAEDIRKLYQNKALFGIEFTINTRFGLLAFRIPVKVKEAYQVMVKQNKRRRTSADTKRLEDQSARTAWKLAQEWLEIQLSMVEMGQVELVQALLTYAVRHDGKTFFEIMGDKSIAMLAAKVEDNDNEMVDAEEIG